MSYELSARAQQDVREHVYFIAATDPRAAAREAARLHAALGAFAAVTVDGTITTIRGWPRPVRRSLLAPFTLFYERRATGLYVVRLYHHARRPIERRAP